MTPDIYAYLICCPLVFLAGFIDAVAGGGGLISIPGFLIAGLPVHYALGTNKLSAMMGTFISAGRYAFKGYVNWKRAAFCILFAFAGSSAGAHLALLMDDTIFKTIMLFVIPATALYLMRGHALTTQKDPLPETKTIILACIISFAIGVYDGFYGPGTGTFFIILFAAVCHFKLTEANGTAKVINLATNIAATVVFFMNDSMLITLGLITGIFSILGNYLGTKFFDKGGAKVVLPIMLTVMTIFFIRIIYDLTCK